MLAEILASNKTDLCCIASPAFSPPGLLPYIGHIGMCRPKGYGFLHRFGVKMGIDFAHSGLESGIVFERATVVYQQI